MKRILKTIFVLTFLFALLVLPGHVALAVLTKTTSMIGNVDWNSVPANTMAKMAAWNISDSYDTILYLEIAYTDEAPQDGVEVIIEVSYGDDDWTLLDTFVTPPGLGWDDFLDGAVVAGETTVTFDGGTEFDVPGQKFFFESGDDEEETVRVKSFAGSTATLCHDLQFNHANATNVWGEVYEYVIHIPAPCAYVKVSIENPDADGDIYFTTRLSKVTSL